jgi:hypothetical protein
MGSTASRSSSKTIESWTFAAVSTTASGTPLRSETRWRFVPFFALSVGFAAVFGPPFGRDGSRIEWGTLPVDVLGLPEAVEKNSVQPLPHPSLLPLFEASPATHPRAAAHLLGQSISQRIPLLRTNTIPVRAARLSMRGLPPWSFGGSGGRSGSMVSHSSSVTSSLAMFSCYPLNGFARRGRYESTKTREVCFRALLNDSDAELSLSIV